MLYCLDGEYPGELSGGQRQRHLTGGLGGCRYHHLWYLALLLPGSLFRSSPKLLHRASGPACRYAGHKSIPSNIQYRSSPPSLPSLRCRMLLFWGRCGKTVHKERDTIAAIFVLDLLTFVGEVIYKSLKFSNWKCKVLAFHHIKSLLSLFCSSSDVHSKGGNSSPGRPNIRVQSWAGLAVNTNTFTSVLQPPALGNIAV